MTTAERIEQVRIQKCELEQQMAAAIEAATHDATALASYAALKAQCAALDDVDQVLRKRAHAERVTALEAAESEASAAWETAHAAAIAARQKQSAALEARRRFYVHRVMMTPEGAAKRQQIERDVIDAQTEALSTESREAVAGQALQQARAALETARGAA